jgi:hypothetical protein
MPGSQSSSGRTLTADKNSGGPVGLSVDVQPTKGIQAQIDDLKAQIKAQEERLTVRREKPLERFTALESALSQFQAQGSFLTQQFAQLAANTSQITSK